MSRNIRNQPTPGADLVLGSSVPGSEPRRWRATEKRSCWRSVSVFRISRYSASTPHASPRRAEHLVRTTSLEMTNDLAQLRLVRRESNAQDAQSHLGRNRACPIARARYDECDCIERDDHARAIICSRHRTRLDSAWARSYAVHDTALAKGIFPVDCVNISDNGSLKNREGELRDIRPQVGLKMHCFRMQDVQIRCYTGACAVV